MRTYTRKKLECQPIEGVQDLCRLCLEKYTASVKIFSDDSDTDVCKPLSMRIRICVGLEMTRDDSLPNAICLDCFKELERYYAFRKKCEITYQKLKSHVQAVKEREQQKLIEIEIKNINEPEMIIFNKLGQEEQNIQHLVYSSNGESPELVNVINGIQIGNLQDLNGCTNGSLQEMNLENQQNNEIQVEVIPLATKSITSAVEMDTSSSPLSMILSSILFELGVLQHQDGETVMIDENVRTVELEGEDNSRVILEIVEEDEDGAISNEIEQLEESKYIEENIIDTGNNLFVTNITNKSLIDQADWKVETNDGLLRGGRSCPTCGKRFASRSVVARHMRVHSGERPFACSTCGKRFAQREVMTRHELVHKAKRPFACEQCPKSFTQRGALAAHARLHAPAHARALALHRCHFCSKVFLYASGLSRHMTVHNGKGFVCNTCGRYFNDKSSLLRHLRKSHTPAESKPQPDAETTITVHPLALQ